MATNSNLSYSIAYALRSSCDDDDTVVCDHPIATMDDVVRPLGKPSDYTFGELHTLEQMKAKIGP